MTKNKNLPLVTKVASVLHAEEVTKLFKETGVKAEDLRGGRKSVFIIIM